MQKEKGNICVFIHFSTQPSIPYYVEIYVNELSKHFDEICILTNERELEIAPHLNPNIRIQFEKNEGYDFGKFYKFYQQEDLSKYTEIAIINDSNILLNELEGIFQKGRSEDVDFWGLIDSTEKPWFSSHKDNYHIQSHFLILNSLAIQKLPLFFESIDLKSIFGTSDSKVLRRLVINEWEIGLSQFLLKEGLKSYAFVQSKSYPADYANLTHSIPEGLIKEGYPLLKRKVFFEAKKKGLKSRSFWAEFITKLGNEAWNLDLVTQEMEATRKTLKREKFEKLKMRFMKWRAAL